MSVAAVPSGITITPIDHLDAIRSREPLTQTAGLALDFVTKVIATPLALLLSAEFEGEYLLAAVKADPILTADPEQLAMDYLSSVASHDSVLTLAGKCHRTKLLGTDDLHDGGTFTGSALENSFLEANDLGPMAVLYMRDAPGKQHYLLILVRSADEAPFSERERGFLRQLAPFLTQSCRTAASAGGQIGPRTGFGTGNPSRGFGTNLTAREFEIAQMAAVGFRNSEIAESLHIATGTVKCHIRKIYAKMGVDSRIHLAQALEN
ncbi:MAG: helix-turn-helix transcriptional regulator [Solirubrobacterales bacterium]